jgi:hypothetical protein
MSKSLKILYITFMVVCVIVGAPLLLAPGRFLGTFSWAPIDPLISRVLGAALLGMAWGCFRALNQKETREPVILIEVFMVFTLLSAIGWLRHLLFAYWWPGIWATEFVMLLFGVAWLIARLRWTKS